MPTDDPYLERLAQAWPPADWADLTVLAAVSGGADSVALLLGLARLAPTGRRGRLIACHFHHGLRGAAADRDQTFVAELCRRLDLPLETGAAEPDALAAARGDGLEAAARQARYAFFRTTADRLGARYLATAHTADDQAETILQRMLRGAGLPGLAGIPRVRPLSPLTTVIRPLLGLRRSEGIAFLARLGQPFCEDETNADPRFTRNRLRHELLPACEAAGFPAACEALARLGEQAAEAQATLAPLIAALGERALVRRSADAVELDCAPLAEASPYLVRALLLELWREQGWPLQAMSAARWQELAGLAQAAARNATPAARDFPGPVRAETQLGRLTLRRSGL